MVPPVIEFDGAEKLYGEKRIGPIQFSLGRGEILGFLGPNGSGKTTCIRMLLGLVRPSAGRVRLGGLDPVRRHIEALTGVGYSPELPNIQTFMTPREVLALAASEIGLKSEVRVETARVLEEVGIIEYGDTKIGKLSKGMVQRLSVAQAMVGSPQTLILDEPMIGLDPAGTAHLRETFREYARNGGTILMSSHMMAEVEDLCSSICLIHGGKLLFRGTPKDMVGRVFGANEIRVEATGLSRFIVEAVRGIEGVIEVRDFPGGLEVMVRHGVEARPSIARLITESGAELFTIREGERMLEKAYIEALKKGFVKAE
ncbi:MAG TPA: ABC transporter ATP-binding protein [Nitrososphaerales archaeon]|nr:ABC transporter ATP-binding protein [Nitrososphaerales archaeon]